jgi:hypothetical protein
MYHFNMDVILELDSITKSEKNNIIALQPFMCPFQLDSNIGKMFCGVYQLGVVTRQLEILAVAIQHRFKI